MNARELQDLLRDLLEEVLLARDDEDDPLAELAEGAGDIRQICTYDEAGILTTDKGLVIECEGGAEYQVTIVKSA